MFLTDHSKLFFRSQNYVIYQVSDIKIILKISHNITNNKLHSVSTGDENYIGRDISFFIEIEIDDDGRNTLFSEFREFFRS